MDDQLKKIQNNFPISAVWILSHWCRPLVSNAAKNLKIVHWAREKGRLGSVTLSQLMSGIFFFFFRIKQSRAPEAERLVHRCCSRQSKRGSGSLPSLVVYYGSLVDQRLLRHRSGWVQAELLRSPQKNAVVSVFLKAKNIYTTARCESLNESVGTSIDFWLRLGVKVIATVPSGVFFHYRTPAWKYIKQARINPKVRLQATRAAVGWKCFQLLFLVHAGWWEQLKPVDSRKDMFVGIALEKCSCVGKLARWMRWRFGQWLHCSCPSLNLQFQRG